jgi:pheromone a factor receptor
MNLIMINKSSSQRRLFLADDGHSLNLSRYWRLMGLAAIEMFGTIIVSCVDISLNISNGMRPWISWEDTHYDFWRADPVPGILWRWSSNSRAAVEITRWTPTVCALVCFAIFGTSQEARKHYRIVCSAPLMLCRRWGSTGNAITTISRLTTETGQLETGVSL